MSRSVSVLGENFELRDNLHLSWAILPPKCRLATNLSLYRTLRGKICACLAIRRVELTPDPDTFEKYRDTPPISIAILLQKHALFLAESSIYTTNLYHDTPPICIAILLQKY